MNFMRSPILSRRFLIFGGDCLVAQSFAFETLRHFCLDLRKTADFNNKSALQRLETLILKTR